MEDLIESLEASLHKGFIDQTIRKSERYKPQLLINNDKQNESVLNSLVEELQSSKSFIFSVAFITESGLATLKSYLLDLKKKGVRGRILTSTFLQFNQPKAFKELLKIDNVEVRLTNIEGFHSKGYIFDHEGHHSLIVGSSNLTAQALKVNYEWNIKLTSHENGEIVNHFKNQFEDIWEESAPLTEQWIEEYEKVYEASLHKSEINKLVEHPNSYEINTVENALRITPNKMQKAALEQIKAVRDAGRDKGLIISATGTGKTYLSAFDVRRYAPKRMLFIVHREQILTKAKEDFKEVLGGVDRDFGIYSGTSKQTDARYLFATIQTISKQENLEQFDIDEFDYILIDEVHKAGANSYQKVINYFEPKFLMGMTATPERTDDFNIYELFDFNIAYEIRLQEAMEEDMLSPFHYFGVTDFEYNGETIDETTILSKLVTDERVNHLIEKINYYGHSGDQVRGLIFCGLKQEAKKLSFALNERGLRTVALTGDDSQAERMYRVNQLENGTLDYILTVDIFNEGVDIPSINQVVMLRQTTSSIIFIQQLGRGLRKHDSKDFVTIIDFIGNYKNNYLIPVALSGDQSQNKDNIRRYTKDTSYIKGVSTVNFEEVAKKRIFQSINKSNLTTQTILKDSYDDLKNRIGRIPYLYDFLDNHSIDPVVIVNKHENYNKFLIKMKEDLPHLSEYENKVLTMLSLEILNGKRKHEVILMKLLFNQGDVMYNDFVQNLQKANCQVDEATLNSVKRIYDLSFFKENERQKYGALPIIELNNDKYSFNNNVKESLSSNRYFKNLVNDIIKSADEKSKRYDNQQPLTLHEKYSRKDVCKLLNWENDESSTMYGYKSKYNTNPIFITYHKDNDIESSVDYEDEFINQEVLQWYTRSNRTLNSKEIQPIINAEEQHLDTYIFVKKDNDEGKEFYYLGKAKPDKTTVKEEKMIDKNGKELPVVRMNLVMDHPIENKLYAYIDNSNDVD